MFLSLLSSFFLPPTVSALQLYTGTGLWMPEIPGPRNLRDGLTPASSSHRRGFPVPKPRCKGRPRPSSRPCGGAFRHGASVVVADGYLGAAETLSPGGPTGTRRRTSSSLGHHRTSGCWRDSPSAGPGNPRLCELRPAGQL